MIIYCVLKKKNQPESVTFHCVLAALLYNKSLWVPDIK